MCSSELHDIPRLASTHGILLGKCSWQEGLWMAEHCALVPCEGMCPFRYRQVCHSSTALIEQNGAPEARDTEW